MDKLCVGVGAGSRVAAADIVAAALAVCGGAPVGVLATLDRKVSEPAFVDAAEALGAVLVGYPADRLAAVTVPNPDDGVATAVGTHSVAEAAAMLAANDGQLVVTKRVTNGVTTAVCIGGTAAVARSVSESVE
ncbi:cobalamin biosynthesis protein [Rhodococcus xishaensis]|uniref:Cobalamin biosynthesis protein n=1 Tax=Rhodococcus xishaensis TaxID=2487364 RepID=A0A438AYV0_9NOCA|nr:cobalamin biosynthesis protein [Rhodococcus xishaensis]